MIIASTEDTVELTNIVIFKIPNIRYPISIGKSMCVAITISEFFPKNLINLTFPTIVNLHINMQKILPPKPAYNIKSGFLFY